MALFIRIRPIFNIGLKESSAYPEFPFLSFLLHILAFFFSRTFLATFSKKIGTFLQETRHLSPRNMPTFSDFALTFLQPPFCAFLCTLPSVPFVLSCDIPLLCGEGFAGFVAADGDEALRFVVVKAAVSAHLDVYKDVGLRQLGHEEGVLANHDRTGTRQ